MRILTDGWTFLESPRWHAGRFWVSDFYTGSVLAVGLDGAVETVAHVPGRPSGLGPLPNGDVLVVSMRDRRVLRLADGALRPHADLCAVATGDANDLIADRDGSAYAGNFGFDLTARDPPRAATLAHVARDGSVRAAAGDLEFPNGMAIEAGTRSLLVAETFGRRISAFAIAPDGSLRDRRVWAAFDDVSPDGIALDREGCLWVADATGRRAVRVRPGGAIDRVLTHGEDGIYACALGGPGGRTLALCAAPTFREAPARALRRSRLLACEVEVPAAPPP